MEGSRTIGFQLKLQPHARDQVWMELTEIVQVVGPGLLITWGYYAANRHICRPYSYPPPATRLTVNSTRQNQRIDGLGL